MCGKSSARFFYNAAGGVPATSREGICNIRQNERIIITGLSCRLPSANNMEEFQCKLLAGIDMVSQQSCLWNSKRLPRRFGFVEDYDKFDAEFFNIVPKLADCMDPQQRKLLEVAFEAVIDAGMNPADLRGTRTGVYVGALGGETMDYHIVTGFSDSSLKCLPMAYPGFMLANRISYALDLKGTSLQANCGCSASLVALEEAVCAIQRGTCDAAIVAGSSIILSPHLTEAFMAVHALSPDGACKTFDNAADGYVRSEAAVAILIQKESAAKRHYATIRHVESNSDGYKAEGIAFASSKGQEALLRSVYANAGIDPASVTYIEAHGTGTPVGDPQEVQAIYNVFCRDVQRDSPLVIGSVKTNIGHTEYAAGLAGVAKVITCIQSGTIPPNLHFKEHNREIKHLFGSALEVASEPRKYEGGLIAVNSFGIGGTNSHLILEPGPTKPSSRRSSDIASDLPVIIPFSGRAEKAVRDCIARATELGAKHSAVLPLIQNVFRQTIPGHSHRGFGICLPQDVTRAQVIEVETVDVQEKRPLWYVFPGVGSQWPNMGRDLMKFDAFAESMTESAKTLRCSGVDLEEILGSGNGSSGGSLYSNIRHALVAISAVQIALLDLLASTGMRPDGYLGHSGGEVLCAYADGCLSREETILVSDAIGRSVLDGEQGEGCTASVGLTLEEAKARCPPQICISCHNGRTNVAISGSPEDVRNFVQMLRAEGVFAKEVNTCGSAVHNRYYVGNAPELLEKYIKDICPESRLRSFKWISTSVPERDWESNPDARYCSATYFANNLLKPVLFHEATRHIPSNAVVVEVAPTGHLQGFLKESLPQCYHTALMSSSGSSKILFFLRRIGELHNVGLDIDLGALYRRAVSYPVPANVPYLSPLVSWNHEKTWSTSRVTYPMRHGRTALLVDLDDPSLSYLRGHKLGHKLVFPAMGYLTLAWRGLAEDHGHLMEDFPITFENVSFERAAVLRPDGAPPIELRFSMLDGKDHFVIRDGETAAVLASGKVRPTPAAHLRCPVNTKIEEAKNEHTVFLTKREAYKELRLRGYHYSGEFVGIERISTDGSKAQVKWTNNWTSFLDAVLQTFLFGIQTRSTLVLTSIGRMTINPQELLAYTHTEEAQGYSVPVVNLKHLQRVLCPGVEVYKLATKVISRPRQNDPLVYEKYTFSPFFNIIEGGESLKDILWKVTDLVKDNVSTDKISALEIAPNPKNCIAALVFQGLDRTWRKWLPKVTLITLYCNADVVPSDIKNDLPVQVSARDSESQLLEGACGNLVVLPDASWLKEDSEVVHGSDFILLRHRPISYNGGQCVSLEKPTLRRVSSLLGDDGQLYELYRKVENRLNFDIIHARINSHTFDWVPQVQSALQQLQKQNFTKRRVYLTSQGDPNCGILGLVKCIRREDGGDKIRAIFDPEGILEIDFQRPNELLSEIMEDDLVTTVLKGRQKGMYCHLPITHRPGSLLKCVKHAHVNLIRTGDLASLRWFESPYSHCALAATPAKPVTTTFCRVAYASINFKDVLFASGKLPVDASFSNQQCLLGYEFSGEDYHSPGKRVMGVVPSQGLATTVTARNDMLFPVPESWTLEDAATVPVAYLSTYWALFQHCQLRPGHSILIHCGSGSVGVAAISVALAHDCEVFITVGSEEEHRCIKERFPQLRNEHIGNSQDCIFELQFMEVTMGRGMDVVLNSLTGDQVEASVRCLAADGLFLEIGDWYGHAHTATTAIGSLKYARFHSASVWKIFENASEQEMRTLRESFLRGLESGVVKPLPRMLFKADQLEEAFCFMAAEKYAGKILIDVETDTKGDGRGGSIRKQDGVKKITALARRYFHPEKTYVVIGGLGGLGIEVASWLVDRGARNLVLPSRSGVTSGYQSMCIMRWETKGVVVEAPRVDLSNFEDAERFVRSVESSGRPLGGVFNSTLVLKDKLMSEQAVEDFEAVGASKILITKHMDTLTRLHCPDLDCFVMFSSIASSLGVMAQSNYGYANATMERICEARAADGLHGLAIQWGAIRDVGFWEEHFHAKSSTKSPSWHSSISEDRIWDFRAQSILSCLEVLDDALQRQDAGPIVISVIMAEKEDEGRDRQGIQKTGHSGLIGIVSKIFGVTDIHKLSPATKLRELGMDSLMAAELRQTLERDFHYPITMKEMSSITIADLKYIGDGSSLAAPVATSDSGYSCSEDRKQDNQPPPQDENK